MINIRDLQPPSYRNLVLRFKGEETIRARIDTGYLDRKEEDQDSWVEGISWSMSSLSFGKWATNIYMMLAHKVKRETPSDDGNFGTKMSFSAWSGIPCSWLANQRWRVHQDQCPHQRHDGESEGPLQKPKDVPRWDQRHKHTRSVLGTYWQCYAV
jgi:hypothetical protein